jgi:hypothetical protein
LFPGSAIVIEAQEKVPPPTAIILLSALPVPPFITTAPDTVRLCPALIVIVFELPPLLIVKVLQTAAVLTVTLKLFGITTSCALVGTRFNDQFAAVFQLLLEEPSHVLVCPDTREKETHVNSKKNNAILIGDSIFLKFKYPLI